MVRTKFIKIFIVLAMLLVFSTAVYADGDSGSSEVTVVDSGSCGDSATWTLYSDGLLEIGGSGEMEDYDYNYISGNRITKAPWNEHLISINKLKINDGITSVGDSSFNGCRYITGTLKLPESIVSIGDYSFESCSGLYGNLVLPSNLTAIGDCAFYGCSGFSGSLTIPNNVTSIGSSAFNGCSGFSGSLTIPNSVTTIGDSAFNGCSRLSDSLTIPNGVTSIGSYAFMNCNGFNGNLILPDSLTTIGNYAFYECTMFSGNLVLPNNLKSIGDFAFFWCGFDGTLTLNEGLQSIGDRAFYGCDFKGTLTIPSSVTNIGSEAFYDCSSLENLIISDSITIIGEKVFYGCSSLKIVTIGSNVDNIRASTFAGCSKLLSATFTGNPPTACGTNIFPNKHIFYIKFPENNEAWLTALNDDNTWTTSAGETYNTMLSLPDGYDYGFSSMPELSYSDGYDYLTYTALANGYVYYYYANSADVPTSEEFKSTYSTTTNMKARLSTTANIADTERAKASASAASYTHIVVCFVDSADTYYKPIVIERSGITNVTPFSAAPSLTVTDNGYDMLRFTALYTGRLYYYYTTSPTAPTVDTFMNNYSSSTVKNTLTVTSHVNIAQNLTYSATVSSYDYIVIMLVDSSNIGYQPVVLARSAAAPSTATGFSTIPTVVKSGTSDLITIVPMYSGTVRFYYTNSATVPTSAEFDTYYSSYVTNTTIPTTIASVTAGQTISAPYNLSSYSSASSLDYVVFMLQSGSTMYQPVVVARSSNNTGVNSGFISTPTIVTNSSTNYDQINLYTIGAGSVYYYYTQNSGQIATSSSMFSTYSAYNSTYSGTITTNGYTTANTVMPTSISENYYVVMMFVPNDYMDINNSYSPIYIYRTNNSGSGGDISVTVPVSSILLNSYTETLNLGSTYQLTATVLPYNATNKSITWSTSNSYVASVDSNGLVTPNNIGSAVITAQSADGLKYAQCTVTVDEIYASSLILDKTAMTIYCGTSEKITATIFPENTSNKDLIWRSYSSTIASVDENGVVTGLKEGYSTITAMTKYGIVARCYVCIEALDVTSLSVTTPSITLKLGETLTVPVSVVPAHALSTLKWSSSSPSIVGVENGVVTALTNGTAVITVSSLDSETKATCTVTVSSDGTGSAIIDSGSCGQNAQWKLYENGLLEISGSGAMTDYSCTYYGVGDTAILMGQTPWQKYIDSITMLRICDSITHIGDYSFYNYMFAAGELDLPDSLVSIGDYAFGECSGLEGDLVIPNKVTDIGTGAFSGCSGFDGTLKLGNSIRNIGDYAFYKCRGFSDDLNIPNSVTSIGNSAFASCDGFDGSLTLSESITNINDMAFAWCMRINGIVEIPDSVVSIGEYAFYNCTELESVIIGEAVTSIGNCAFYNIRDLSSARFNGNPPFDCGLNIFSTYNNFRVHYPHGNENWAMSINGNSTWTTFSGNTYNTVASYSNAESASNGFIDIPTVTTSYGSNYLSFAVKNDGYVYYYYSDNNDTVTIEQFKENYIIQSSPKARIATEALKSNYVQISTGYESSAYTSIVLCYADRNFNYKTPIVIDINSNSDDKAGNGFIIDPYVGTNGTYDVISVQTASYGTLYYFYSTGRVAVNRNTFFQLYNSSQYKAVSSVSYGYQSLYYTNYPSSYITSTGQKYVTFMMVSSTGTQYNPVTVQRTYPGMTPDDTYVTSVTLNRTSMQLSIGNTNVLKATVMPTDASNKEISWYSSDSTVASISDEGVVTALKCGSATITVTTVDGNKSASCKVTVLHNMTYDSGKNANCHTTGEREHWHCSSCGKNYADINGTSILSSLSLPFNYSNHDGGTRVVNTMSATSWSNGYTGDTLCNGCGRTISYGQSIPAYNGIISNGNIGNSGYINTGSYGHVHSMIFIDDTSATCISTGTISHWHCSGCGGNYSDSNGTNAISTIISPLDMNNHTGRMKVRNEVEATLTTEGYTGDTYCMDCGELVIRGDIVPAQISLTSWKNPYIDVYNGDRSYEAIAFVTETGIFKGVSAREFAPQLSMTRAMFVTALGRMAEIETMYFNFANFTDTESGAWYTPYVAWASNAGIVNGYGDGRFGVNDNITIEQALVMLYRYAEYSGVSTRTTASIVRYADSSDVSSWAYDVMCWAVGNGIYTGNGALLNPKGIAQRDVIADMIYRFMLIAEN